MSSFADHASRLLTIRSSLLELSDRLASTVDGLVGVVPTTSEKQPGKPVATASNFIAECNETSGEIENIISRMDGQLTRLNS